MAVQFRRRGDWQRRDAAGRRGHNEQWVIDFPALSGIEFSSYSRWRTQEDVETGLIATSDITDVLLSAADVVRSERCPDRLH